MIAPKRKLTIDEFYELYEDEPYELIDGEAVLKTSWLETEVAPSPQHGIPQACLMMWLGRRFAREPGGRWPGGWRILTDVGVGYPGARVFSHDLVGWRRDRLRDVPTEDWGKKIRPDWVCEVMSPGHEKRDLVEKMGVLHAAGVPYYWVIDRVEKVLFPYKYDPRGYLLVRAVSSGETIRAEPFEEVELRTGVVFGDDDDEE